MFVDKYNDAGKLTIEIHAHASYLITDLLTHSQDYRELRSKLIIHSETEIYNYPFIHNRIYVISPHEVKDVTP